MAKSEHITIRLKPETLKACDQIAKELATNRTNFISIVLERVTEQMMKELKNGKSNK